MYFNTVPNILFYAREYYTVLLTKVCDGCGIEIKRGEGHKFEDKDFCDDCWQERTDENDDDNDTYEIGVGITCQCGAFLGTVHSKQEEDELVMTHALRVHN